ncbi:MAG: hypothetical protein HY331_13500 [Chloroflexi bacterium]|nr:hypothetical protein [Chloroflexota bacterium]
MAVGVDPSETAEVLKRQSQANRYPWQVAVGTPAMLKEFNVVSTSIKYAVNRQGVITYQAGYGAGDEAAWRKMFEELVAP